MAALRLALLVRYHVGRPIGKLSWYVTSRLGQLSLPSLWGR